MNGSGNKNRYTWLAACALWIVAWQAASLLVGSDILLAGPLDTCAHLVTILTSGKFFPALWFSFSRIAGGFLAAFVLGVALGFAAHGMRWLRELLAPLVLSFKSVPVACIVVLLLIWVGSREVSGLAVFLMAFPALYLSTVEGLGQVDPKVDEMLTVFGVGEVRRFLAHTWPSVLPYLVAMGKNACGMAWKAGVAAELIGSPLGSMGERIYQAKILLETADLFAWTVIVVVASFAFERAFIWCLQATGPLALRLAASFSKRRGQEEPCAASELVFEHAVLGYEGVAVLTDVDLALEPGERAVLADASGGGKTTLLHTLARLLPVQAGTMRTAQRISMVFQETRLIEDLDAVSNVMLVGAGGRSVDEVGVLLAEVLPQEALGKPVRELSGGQRRRVEIVRALAHPSSAVLLDEPFASLDKDAHEVSAAFVLRHLEGRTLLVASHAPEDVDLLDSTRVSRKGILPS